MRYKTNANEYSIYGNETYSGVSVLFCLFLLNKKEIFEKNSLVCKSAMHDGRVAPWNGENSPVLIRNNSIQSTIFPSALRNGILSTKLDKLFISFISLFFLSFLKININILQ
jgi:hypothetical protein